MFFIWLHRTKCKIMLTSIACQKC